MAGLKELRIRISSIKSTQKITSAMKMVAAARLRKAQNLLNDSAPYNQTLINSINRVIQELLEEQKTRKVQYIFPKIFFSKPESKKHLLLVFSSDRGLCGGFNVNVAKATTQRMLELERAGKEVKIICVGRKGRDILKRKYSDRILESIEGIASKGAAYYEAEVIADKVYAMYDKGEIDVLEIVSSEFRSAISREVTVKQILPLTTLNNFPGAPKSEHSEAAVNAEPIAENLNMSGNALYDYEPDKMEMLMALVPQLFSMHIFQAIAHSQASEQGARMTSMDSATRNARDMISNLTLKYNGIRQSAITTELIEIISGAEAL